MKAYKGFNKDMTCRGFQFKEGETYHEETAELCKSGFHACEDPIDCFEYYDPAGSVYREVELEDLADERNSADTKVCAKTIKIGAEIGIPGIVKAKFDYIKRHTTAESADNEAASAGESGAASAGAYGAASAGESGAASAGESGAASAGFKGAASAGAYGAAVSRGSAETNKNGIAVVRGNRVKARGGIGTVIVICEEEGSNYGIKEWKAAIVDGEKIKANTWYTLKDGEFVEVDGE